MPFAADSFDRYVSAGSIEYWPEPQRGIKEAYRLVTLLIAEHHHTSKVGMWRPVHDPLRQSLATHLEAIYMLQRLLRQVSADNVPDGNANLTVHIYRADIVQGTAESQVLHGFA